MAETNFDTVNAKVVKRDGVTKVVKRDGVTITDSQVTAAVVAALTENGGAIGGTNNGDLPSLAPTYVARTGSVGGTANGAFEDEGTLSTSNTYTDAAVNTVIGKLKNNIAELKTTVEQLAADNVALAAANRENAAKINAILTSLKTATLMESA